MPFKGSRKTGNVRRHRRSRRSVKKNGKGKRKPVRRSKFQKLERRVGKLSMKVSSLKSRSVYRSTATAQVLTTDNLISYVSYNMSRWSDVVGYLTTVRMYDASAASFSNVDVTNAIYTMEFNVARQWKKVVLRSNYLVPMRVTAYLCTCKKMSDIGPATIIANNLPEVSNGTGTSHNLYPTDSSLLLEFFNVKKLWKGTILPGQERSWSHSIGPITVNYNELDTVFDNYQPDLKSFSFLFRLEGYRAHDTVTANQVGYGKSGVDVYTYQTAELEYDGGGNFTYTYVSNGEDLMTAGPHLGQLRQAAYNVYTL